MFKLPEVIIHQKQPTGNSCVSTCIAMITGTPASEVVENYHEMFSNHEIEIADILDDFDVEYGRPLAGNQRMFAGHVYLLIVPSLNLQGQFHEIVCDYRDGNNVKVLDPSKGHAGKRYYALQEEVDDDEDGLAFPLISWMVEYFIEDTK